MAIRRMIRASILAKIALFTALFSLVPLYVVTSLFVLKRPQFLWDGLGALAVLTAGGPVGSLCFRPAL